MQPATSKETEIKKQMTQKVISFSEGIPAFEYVKEFVIISNEEEAPFLWLQAVSTSNLAFLTIDPFLVLSSYRPDISEADVEQLKIESPEDVMLLSIVNLRHNADGVVTANLVSPIVINWREKIGKQVILKNHLEYSVRHVIENEAT